MALPFVERTSLRNLANASFAARGKPLDGNGGGRYT